MNGQSPRVLIIDNDEGVVEALAIRLGNEGFVCETAGSGSQGLALFQGGEFDAVLTDLNMPSGNGVSVIESIRNSSRVPILIITGFESSFAEEIAGFENVFLIRKPFDLETLIDELDIAISMTELR